MDKQKEAKEFPLKEHNMHEKYNQSSQFISESLQISDDLGYLKDSDIKNGHGQ